MDNQILIVGGYGEVGRRLTGLLESTRPGRVIVGGRHLDVSIPGRARRVDVDDRASIERALDGIGLVIACVRQREPHLLRAAIRRGIGYTSIAPPWIPWPDTPPLRAEAERTGARVILAAGLEPGISSMLVMAAAERLDEIDSVESALLLGLGDTYGADSMAFIFEELTQQYSIVVDGTPRPALAFDWPKQVQFPPPIGPRTAWTMPFTDQRYYPVTVGAQTAIARIALDPPWLGSLIAGLLRIGLRSRLGQGGGRALVHRMVQKLRRGYAQLDQFALVLEVGGAGRSLRSTLIGRGQADATAAGAWAIAEALWAREMDQPGVWLPEQVIDPGPFFRRLASRGLVPVTEERTPRDGRLQPQTAAAPAHARGRPWPTPPK